MKKIELTMHVIEDRTAPLLLTEKNLPGACCCSCCCCFSAGAGNSGGSSQLPMLDASDLKPVAVKL